MINRAELCVLDQEEVALAASQSSKQKKAQGIAIFNRQRRSIQAFCPKAALGSIRDDQGVP